MDIKEAKELFLSKHDYADEKIDSFNENIDSWIAFSPNKDRW